MSIKKDKKTDLQYFIESSIGGRSENQDFASGAETPIGTVIVVCDGMGGMNGGSTASRLAVQTVIDDLKSAGPDASPSEALRNAVIHANEVVVTEAANKVELAGMGTTLTAVIINDDCATVAYVGDSRVYQLRGRNKVFRTFDHSFVFESVRIGIITEEQARLSSQSNIILRALGIKPEIEVDIYELPYLPGDRFLLCTDGFWGAMPEKEFLKMVTKGRAGEVLKKSAVKIDLMGIRHGGQHDNLTAAMCDVNKESKKKVKMTAKIKVLVSVLAALLLASLAFNAYQLVGGAKPERLDTEQSIPTQPADSTQTNVVGSEVSSESNSSSAN